MANGNVLLHAGYNDNNSHNDDNKGTTIPWHFPLEKETKTYELKTLPGHSLYND